MPTRNVVLTDHQASLVERLVTSGRYQNVSEVLPEGLRLVEQRETEDAYRLDAPRAAAQAGIADIEAGRFKTFDSKESLRSHFKSVSARALSTRNSHTDLPTALSPTLVTHRSRPELDVLRIT